MKKYEHLKAKARFLRKRDGVSLGELVKMLSMPKTTVYYWIKDLPLPHNQVTEKRRLAAKRAGIASKRKYKKLRQEAYDAGVSMIDELTQDPTFRDFVSMYIGEGTKKGRNTVAVCNSDPSVIQLCIYWIRQLANPERRIGFELQHFEDQDVESLRIFWAEKVGTKPSNINPRLKTSSGKLSRRNWRSKYGVMTVRVGDTYLRAKLEAWMDWIKGQWRKNASLNPVHPTRDGERN